MEFVVHQRHLPARRAPALRPWRSSSGWQPKGQAARSQLPPTEGFADEHLARAACGSTRQRFTRRLFRPPDPWRRGALQHHHLGGLFSPVRVQQLLLQQGGRRSLPSTAAQSRQCPGRTRRVVSTNSAQTIQRPGFLFRCAPGWWELDAAGALVPVFLSRRSCSPTLPNHCPASMDAPVQLLAGPAGVLMRQPCSVTTVSSWVWMSRHSRKRRMLMKFCAAVASYWRLLSLWVAGGASGIAAAAAAAAPPRRPRARTGLRWRLCLSAMAFARRADGGWVPAPGPR